MLHPLSAACLHSIPATIFSAMSRLALEHNAVNLGQGFPDFDGPSWIIDEALEAMRSGKNQYAPMNGVRSLRLTIAQLYRRYYELDYDPDSEITVTAGATEALFSTITAIMEPGAEAIVFEPFYDSHQANVLLSGGVPRYITLHKPHFQFDGEELRNAITPRTRMIILNNPHNPTGKVFTREELLLIAGIAQEHNLLVLSDEVYEFLTYDDARHIPIASLPGMKERTITVSSTGKTFGMTGWKIGYAVAPVSLTNAVQKVHQFVTFAVNTPAQHAMAHALERLDSWLPELRSTYGQKRDMMFEGLRGTIFTPISSKGTYFMMASIPEELGMNDVALADAMVRKHGVAVIPPSCFYGLSNEGETMLRLCFAKKDETLFSGIEKLRAFGK